jgi:hypothetical protein
MKPIPLTLVSAILLESLFFSTSFIIPCYLPYTKPNDLQITHVYSNAFDIDSQDVLSKLKQSNQKIINNTSDLLEDDEDGYKSMMKPYRPLLEKMLHIPWKLVRKITFPEKEKEPGVLILVRHGESIWNSNKTFTGWADPDLSERGYREVEHAARLLLEGGYEIDVVFTSRLKRAIRSAWILLQELNQVAYNSYHKSMSNGFI